MSNLKLKTEQQRSTKQLQDMKYADCKKKQRSLKCIIVEKKKDWCGHEEREKKSAMICVDKNEMMSMSTFAEEMTLRRKGRLRRRSSWVCSVSLLAVRPQPVHTLSDVTDHGDHAGAQAQGSHHCIQFPQQTWDRKNMKLSNTSIRADTLGLLKKL